jgi:hypothetical protein
MSYSLPTNEHIRLNLSALDGAGLPSPTHNETFSSSDSTIAKVNANGRVTPVAPGEVIITCTAESKGKSLTSEFAITVVSSKPTTLLVEAVVV